MLGQQVADWDGIPLAPQNVDTMGETSEELGSSETHLFAPAYALHSRFKRAYNPQAFVAKNAPRCASFWAFQFAAVLAVSANWFIRLGRFSPKLAL